MIRMCQQWGFIDSFRTQIGVLDDVMINHIKFILGKVDQKKVMKNYGYGSLASRALNFMHERIFQTRIQKQKQQSRSIQIITLQQGKIMGAQCVKSQQKVALPSHYSRMGSLEQQLRNRDEHLLFTMTIEHLRLTNMTDKVKEIKFSLQKQFEIVYPLSEFNIQENLIKSEKTHKTQFEFPAKCLDSKKVLIEIFNFKNQVIESLNLKLIHLCTGPVHHDHLLKELRARLMFDLHLYQNINLNAKCKNLKIDLFDSSQLQLDQLSYKLTLTTDMDERTFESKSGHLTKNLIFSEEGISVSLPNNVLKQSNFRFEFLKSETQGEESAKMIHAMFVPFRKVQSFDTFVSLTKKSIDYIKRSIPFEEQLQFGGKAIGKITFILDVESSILYAQQMECLIFSEIGVSSVSPTLSYQSNEGLIKEIKEIYKSVKKFKNSLTDQKEQLIKNIDQIYSKFQKSNQQIFTSEEQLYERQLTLIKLLNELSGIFAEGDDALNERLWRTIIYIVHKPQLSTRYLTLHQSENTKKAVYLRYYKFIITALSKIIVCTGTGITFHELQCIQKFIAFAYFRFPWIQQRIIESLRRHTDPLITQEKLIEYGANGGCRSPSKSYVYDWEVNVYRKIENDPELKEQLQKLEETSNTFEGWDNLLFSREDQDLFYGLYLEIWTQAEISIKNLKGKIMWEYFPNYGQLLSCFLGEMNNSKISDFSTLFKKCSSKLILNQKLLNTFVVLLFPKTYLFEISCVLKCLNLLQSYFEVLTSQNKKLPHDFHFNVFHTGVISIFDQNHSYVVVKVLYILYKFYDIFTLEFKKILNSFFLSNVFYSLFLHWCTNVRQMFHHLIYFKLLQKKIANPEEVQESNNSSRAQNKSHKSSSYSEEYLLNRKICHYIRAIENCSIDLSKEVKNQSKICKKPLHQKMRLKLEEKKKQRLQETEGFDELSESKISEDDRTSSFMARKMSLFNENTDFEFHKMRKMSVADEFYPPKIENEHRQYCIISLKEYDEVKRKQNSAAEVEKLAKLVQGDIDS